MAFKPLISINPEYLFISVELLEKLNNSLKFSLNDKQFLNCNSHFGV